MAARSVSDAMTVASKAAVALLAVPLIVYVLSLVVSLVLFAALSVKYSGTALAPMLQWHTLDWRTLQGVLLLNIAVASLWYAPIAEALLALVVMEHALRQRAQNADVVVSAPDIMRSQNNSDLVSK